MTDYKVELTGLIKFFGRRLIFSGINFSFLSGNVYGISGPNGSGKSTLVKIIANLISPTKGEVVHKFSDKPIDEDSIHHFLGFVSPYLFLYDEFSAEENLIHFARIRGMKFNKDYSDLLLNELKLYERKDDLVRGYSSGMKQRLKFAFALLHNPKILILDEPTSNLDSEGKEKVYQLISEGPVRQNEEKDKLVIIASNEDADLSLCKEIIEMEKFKKQVQSK